VVAVHRRQQQHGAGEKEPEPRQPVTLHLKAKSGNPLPRHFEGLEKSDIVLHRANR
jgi:hypothetical protein